MQVKLLRAIQEKKVRMVGGTTEETVDVRIISATHKNLNAMMDEGVFRQDLYYRLNVIQLKMPSLRDRASDIPLLAEMLLSRQCASLGIDMPKLTQKALTYIKSLPFYGNVRELENMLERALALCDGITITVDDLMLDDGNYTPASQTNEQNANYQLDVHTEISLPDYLEGIEKRAIVSALDKTQNNKTAAAKLLGVSFRTLRYRLAKLGLSKEEDQSEEDLEE